MELIPSIKGMYRDILKREDGHIIYDSGWTTNTIVDRCRILLAGFMKKDPSTGIQYLAVGSGSEYWDTPGGGPDPDTTRENLVNEYTERIPYDDLALVYLDEFESVVEGPTNRLQITATLAPGYPAHEAPLKTYPLREFGLFGSFNGDNYMINYITHPVIHKDEFATLIRGIRLHF